MFKIIRTIKDLAGKIRIFVDPGDGEVLMFKFAQKPTTTQITDEIKKQAEAKTTELERQMEIK